MGFGLILLAIVAGDPAEKVGSFSEKAIVEPSGMVASRKHPGIFWIHNDSGNTPTLFAVRRNGSLVRTYQVDAPNIDWEDITIDDNGHLYIGDIGDNLKLRPIVALHQIDEPDPAVETESSQKLKAKPIYFRYPDRNRRDAEGLFIDDGRAVVVTKRGDLAEPELFSVALDASTSLLKPADAKSIGSLKGFKKPATGASLSLDGRWLAVCGIGEVKLYHRDADLRWWNTVKLKSPPGQIEAIAWDGKDLLLANEDRVIYLIAERIWKAEIRDKGKGP